MLKNAEKHVIAKINIIVIHIASNSLYMENGSGLSSLFLDLLKLNSNKSPQKPVDITHNVDNLLVSIILNLFNNIRKNIDIVQINPVGRDFFNTFFKNEPVIFSLFGSNASKNEGVPIVTKLIRLS